MKYAKFTIFLSIFFSILIAFSVPAASQSGWKVVIPKSIEGSKVRMAAFLDKNFGVWGGAGDQGAPHYTLDGGKTWTKANTGGCMFSVDIVDAKTLWYSCISGTSMSTDGGKSWKVIDDKIGGMASILAFADDKTGWVGSGINFNITTDGGKTWNKMALPASIGNVAAISLRTPMDGYLIDEDITLHITQDGGKTWTSRSLGIDDADILGFGSGGWINETPQAAIRFLDKNNGLVVLGLSGKTNLIALRTADGGKTWKEESIPAKPGKPFISRDGKLLTVSKWGEGLTLLECK